MRSAEADTFANHPAEGGDRTTKTYLNLAAFEADLNGGDLTFVAGIGAAGLTTLYCLVQNQSAATYEIARIAL